MVGKKDTAFLIVPFADAVTTNGRVCENIINLHRRNGMETVIGSSGFGSQVDHTGHSGYKLHFFAVRLRVHITDKNAGSIREEGFTFQLLGNLLNAQDSCGMSYVIQMSIGKAEYLICGKIMECCLRAYSGTGALNFISGAGNEGGGGKPVAIQLHKIKPTGQEGDTCLFALKVHFSGTADDVVFREVLLKPEGDMGKYFLKTDNFRLFLSDLIQNHIFPEAEIVRAIPIPIQADIKSD